MSEARAAYEQNVANDGRMTDFADGHLLQLQKEIDDLLTQREDLQKSVEVAKALANLRGTSGWEALKIVLVRWRQEALEGLVAAQAGEIVVLQVRARIFQNLLDVVENANLAAEDQQEQLDHTEQQLESVQFDKKAEGGGNT